MHRFSTQGVVLEWLKRHAWKACLRQKRNGGSNPPHSAIVRGFDGLFVDCAECGKTDKNGVKSGILTDKKPTKLTRMQNIHVSLYWRDRVGRDGLSPLLLAVNYGGSSTYVKEAYQLVNKYGFVIKNK